MKKIVSLAMAGIMLLGACPMVYAAEAGGNWGDGTNVSYTADADANQDGISDAEYYEVTVPAAMAPGGSSEVSVAGTWASNRKLVVTADATVTLTNSITGGDEKVLNVNFDGIGLAGDNEYAITKANDGATVAISIDNIEDALFGTWSGHFDYTVGMEDVQ